MKLLKDLAVAMLNATLILLALCLFLAWKVGTTVNSVTATFAQNLITVEPLADEVRSAKSEIVALRQDIAAAMSSAGSLNDSARIRLQSRTDQLETRIDAMSDAMQQLADLPTTMLDHALEKSAAEVVDGIQDIRDCKPPESDATS